MTSQAIEPSGVSSPAPTVVNPTAMAGPVHSATWALGEVLKEIIHKGGVYLTENALHEAEAIVSAWVKSVVPLSAVAALSTGDERAPREDVSKRIPPGGLPAIPVVTTAPAIDYDRLAEALLAAQQRSQAQLAAAQVKSAADFQKAAAAQQVMGQ